MQNMGNAVKIHGRATSINVQAVMWGAAEMGVPVDRLDVGGAFGGNDTPEFRAMNPMGRIPVLEDDGFVLFESQSILRYLGRKAGSALWPEALQTRATADQWMEWAKVNVMPAVIYKVFMPLVLESRHSRDMARVAQGTSELKSLMGVADAQIARTGWLAGHEMTLADISFGTQLYRYFTVDFEKADLPALADYYDRLTGRPAYAEHVMVSYDKMRHPDA